MFGVVIATFWSLQQLDSLTQKETTCSPADDSKIKWKENTISCNKTESMIVSKRNNAKNELRIKDLTSSNIWISGNFSNR